MAKIAGWKVDKVARIMVKPMVGKSNEIKKEMEQILTDGILKVLPKDVVSFFEKYPNRINKQGYISLKTEIQGEKKKFKTSMYVYPKCPEVSDTDLDKVLKEGTPLLKQLNRLQRKEYKISAEATSFENKIKCTLSKLSTYAKIRDNFPEAYKVLTEKVDKVENDEESICDNVEKLRAEFNKKSK